MISVADKKIPWHDGITVADIIAELDDGHLYAVVRINEEFISRPNFASTRVPDGAEIFLIPMVAGG